MKNNHIERIKKVKEKAAQKEIGCFLIKKPENIIYLTGFKSSECSLLFTEEKDYLVTDFRYIEAAKGQCSHFEILCLDKDHTLWTFIREARVATLGIEEDVLTVNDYRKLQEEAEISSFLDAGGVVEAVRAVKDETEIDCITRAAALGDKCFSHMLDFLKTGMTEKEAALEVELFFKRNGAERLSFDTICVSGVKSSMPHGIPSGKVIEKGDFLTMDFGCVLDGYCSDMTRTVAFGSVTDEQAKVYNLVLEAQLKAIEGISQGISCADADRLARERIVKEGYGEYFGHGLGHGVGLEIHEAPTLNSRSREILEENMAVTIEPGIYLPKKFGVRIEDLAIVTSFGIINKVHSPKELIIL